MNIDREIYQLWHAATTYCDKARSLISSPDITDSHKHMKAEDLTKYFEKGIPKDVNIRNLSMVNAHLSSAAIRLYTISEKDCHYTMRDNYLKECKSLSPKDVATIKSYLSNNKDRFIHSLLRDNIGHEEESKKLPKFEHIFMARQEFINDLEIAEIYRLMKDIKDKFAKEFQLPLGQP